eukprot:147899-Amorphochlora_amoeboformis.AAC.3
MTRMSNQVRTDERVMTNTRILRRFDIIPRNTSLPNCTMMTLFPRTTEAELQTSNSRPKPGLVFMSSV